MENDTQKRDVLSDMLFMKNFIQNNIDSGKLSEKTSADIESLWNKYKLTTVDDTCAIIKADFGILGSLYIQYVSAVDEPIELKYERGSYDYVSVQTDRNMSILWTDYEDIEPYNRQAGLYCAGASFRMLGEPIVQKKQYREYQSDKSFSIHSSFSISGYRYNSFYGSIQFGLCLKKDHVNEFIKELRLLIGKLH